MQFRDGIQVVGYFRTALGCEATGLFGRADGYWDEYDCTPVRIGPRAGSWALQVASIDNWDRLGFEVPLRAVCVFPVKYRPVWPGQFAPGRPAPAHFDRGPSRFDKWHPRVRDHRGPDHRGPHGPSGPGHHGPSGPGHHGPSRGGSHGPENSGPHGPSGGSSGGHGPSGGGPAGGGSSGGHGPSGGGPTSGGPSGGGSGGQHGGAPSGNQGGGRPGR
ncbi:hypothetical protein [Actinoplanes sp. NPDC051851]|uniref:hypothetical protein n=1 Tax=Actinoplanes sp. NPDC051851 TaxID=3154753 RepID=UPI003436DC6F